MLWQCCLENDEKASSKAGLSSWHVAAGSIVAVGGNEVFYDHGHDGESVTPSSTIFLVKSKMFCAA